MSCDTCRLAAGRARGVVVGGLYSQAIPFDGGGPSTGSTCTAAGKVKVLSPSTLPSAVVSRLRCLRPAAMAPRTATTITAASATVVAVGPSAVTD